MTDQYESDEDRYANESFENESDSDITKPDETDHSSSDNEIETVMHNNPVEYSAKYKEKSSANAYRHNRDYATYESSSDDENDVVISEVIAEINTAPMILEDSDLAAMRPMQLKPQKQNSDSKSVEESKKITMIEPRENEESESDVYSNESDLEDEIDEEMLKTTSASEYTDDNTDGEDDERTLRQQLYEEYVQANKVGPNESDVVMNISETKATVSTETFTVMSSRSKCAPKGEDCSIMNGNDVKATASTETFTVMSSRSKCAPNCDDCTIEPANDETPVERNGNESDNNDDLIYDDYDQSVDVRISSNTPTSFNSDDYAFHMNLMKRDVSSSQTKLKAAHRKSWSFSNERMREIERQNQILLKKILTQKPSNVSIRTPKKFASNTKLNKVSAGTRVSSAAVNRKKQQRQIDLDNQLLKRKIEAISLRRPLQ